MSQANVQRSFVAPLLKVLNEGTREKVEGQGGQLLLLEDANAFKKVVETSLGQKVPSEVLARALKVGQKKALTLQNNYIKTKIGKRRYNTITRRMPHVLRNENLEIGKNAFVVASFGSSIPAVKKAMIDSIFDSLGIDNATKKEAVSYNIHRGHGEAGLAVSQVQLAGAFNRAQGMFADRKLLAENFSAFLLEANIQGDVSGFLHQVDALSTRYEHMVTRSGDLKAQYFSIVTFQDQGSNADDGIMEKKLLTLFRKFINTKFADQVADMKGSPSIKDKIGGHIMHEATGNLNNNKNVHITDTDYVAPGTKSHGDITLKNKKRKSKARIDKKAPGALRGPAGAKGVSSTPLIVLTLLNKQLPDVVKKNMGAPRLENQTGRFAESVRIVDVATTPQGYPSFGYTYMKQPYQVFEMGAGAPPWATPHRDPRKLIDKSIREVAAEFAIGRFFTRRV